MPTLAENVSERLVIKAHSSTTYDPTTEPAPITDPGSSGGQIWRYLDCNLSLTRDTWNSPEILQDQQQGIDNTGTKRVPVTVNTALSCASHKIAIEAVLRGTWSASVISASNSELTSAAADNATSKFTFAGGDPVSIGFRVGQIIQFLNLSDGDNNGVNYLVVAFSGASNREMTVYPAPDTMTADTSFSVTTVGRSVYAPASSPVKRKFAIERYNADSDLGKLFTEITLGGMSWAAAPNADVTVGFTGVGRNRYLYEGGSAPFFTSPSAAPTGKIISAMDGLIRSNGATIAGLTALNFDFQRQLQALAQIKRDGLTAGVVAQGNAVISGGFTAFELDHSLQMLFDNKTEFEIIAMLSETQAINSPMVTAFLPRCKITAIAPTLIDGSPAQQCTFSAGRYMGSAPGYESTSLFIHDTAVA